MIHADSRRSQRARESPPRPCQGIPGENGTVLAQIRADRYYAAHLLGDLKDPRGVDLLVPLLNDQDVGYIVPWSLAEISDRRAVGPLIGQLERDDPSVRVLAIYALERLNAREACHVESCCGHQEINSDRTLSRGAAAIAVIYQCVEQPSSEMRRRHLRLSFVPITTLDGSRTSAGLIGFASDRSKQRHARSR